MRGKRLRIERGDLFLRLARLLQLEFGNALLQHVFDGVEMLLSLYNLLRQVVHRASQPLELSVEVHSGSWNILLNHSTKAKPVTDLNKVSSTDIHDHFLVVPKPTFDVERTCDGNKDRIPCMSAAMTTSHL